MVFFAGSNVRPVQNYYAVLKFAFSTVLSKYPSTEYPQLLDNLLSIMEKLTTFPTDPSELNTWWVEELGAKPPKHRSAKGATEEEDPESADENHEDDWRNFFDEDASTKDTKTKGIKGRAHTLTFHQSLHSLQAHRAVFTRTWLNFLPHLSSVSTSSNRALTTRALNIMHRGVLPHLTRPVLVMDWISACVDLGEATFMGWTIWLLRRSARRNSWTFSTQRSVHPNARL